MLNPLHDLNPDILAANDVVDIADRILATPYDFLKDPVGGGPRTIREAVRDGHTVYIGTTKRERKQEDARFLTACGDGEPEKV